MTAGYLYVFPCAYEDLLKLGHSRDPLRRMYEINPRYYEFFDVDRAFLVMTETVREAQQLETRYHRALIEHGAPAPLTVNDRAGYTEWYRGAYDALLLAAQHFETLGYRVHRPLRPWLRQRLQANVGLLHSSGQMLTADELAARGLAARATTNQRRVADMLDAYAAFGFDLREWLAQPLLDWHRAATAWADGRVCHDD